MAPRDWLDRDAILSPGEDSNLRALTDSLAPPLQCAVFGWIDQAVFETAHYASGSRSILEAALGELDSYRPDQGGDFALAIGGVEWCKTFFAQVSFEHGWMEAYALVR